LFLYPTRNHNADFVKDIERESHQQLRDHIRSRRNDRRNDDDTQHSMAPVLPHKSRRHQPGLGKKEDHNRQFEHNAGGYGKNQKIGNERIERRHVFDAGDGVANQEINGKRRNDVVAKQDAGQEQKGTGQHDAPRCLLLFGIQTRPDKAPELPKNVRKSDNETGCKGHHDGGNERFAETNGLRFENGRRNTHPLAEADAFRKPANELVRNEFLAGWREQDRLEQPVFEDKKHDTERNHNDERADDVPAQLFQVFYEAHLLAGLSTLFQFVNINLI